ncbi:hypothetical protein L484_006277 [Morus notabilis]|uniref:Uncharacterized protein n=1 Tax=Morus notabilis TaxID=981085 RepID=W9QU86_9ROSA|nr:hypothetical protein L484_006277 [Morus notabilis]
MAQKIAVEDGLSGWQSVRAATVKRLVVGWAIRRALRRAWGTHGRRAWFKYFFFGLPEPEPDPYAGLVDIRSCPPSPKKFRLRAGPPFKVSALLTPTQWRHSVI